MKVIILRVLIVLMSILFVPLMLGYVNWDILYISTAGEWTEEQRAFLSIFTMLSIAIGVGCSAMIEGDKK